MAGSEARQRISEKRQQQIAQQHKKEQRKKLWLRIGIPVAALVVIAVVFAVVANLPRGTSSDASGSASAAAVAAKVTTVPASVLNTVGASGVAALPTKVKASALSSNGKPEVLYVGAEYCPFCAAERWPMTVALSRFGTFHNLGLTSSESNDVYPNTATLSFYGSTYTSRYITFVGREVEDRNGQPLQKLTSAQQKIFATFDAPPYTQSSGSIPFVDVGGKYVVNGASYDPQVLHGKTHIQIADALHDPSSTVGKNVGAVANVLTASICTLTDQQPAKVCTSPGVSAGAKTLAKAK